MHRRRKRTFWVVWLIVGLCLIANIAEAARIGRLYRRSTSAFRYKRYQRAARLFSRLLPLLERQQRRRRKGTRAWHMWTIAQSEVFAYLSTIAWARGQPRRGCRAARRMIGRLRTVPSGWRLWGLPARQIARLMRAKQTYQRRCVSKQSWLMLRGSPAQSKVELQVKGEWYTIGKTRTQVAQTRITLRISAPGYVTQIKRDIPVQRGTTTTVWYRLSRPTIAKVPALTTPRAKPTIQPWIWVVVGVGSAIVAGTVIGIAVAGSQPPSKEGLSGPNGSGPLTLWKATP